MTTAEQKTGRDEGGVMDNAVIKTAGRVFEVLEYFREVRKPLSVRDIAEHFGYPLSSTSVLAKSIATLGYLSYDSRIRAYSPTILVAMLGDWIYESSFSSAEIVGLMRSLSESTRETVILAVQNDIFAQYVQVIQSLQPIQFFVSPGTRRPLCWSGTGWALLASHSDATIGRIHQRSLGRIGRAGLPKALALEDVMSQVSQVRKNGYVLSRGTNTPGVGVIAMPLPAAANGARLVVGIGGLIERLEDGEKSIVKQMRDSIDRYLNGKDPAGSNAPRKVVAPMKKPVVKSALKSAPKPAPKPAAKAKPKSPRKAAA
jgi:DNA-binding IclR family transcriptional regulator